MPDRWRHRFARVNGVRLHYVEAGEGPLVVLLHGFPECWYAWRRQIPVLADAGFRVVAPDMRGYDRSEKPDGVRAYRLSELTADVAALIDRLGDPSASVVGHDWGGGVAWRLPVDHPESVDRVAALNAPHPGGFARRLLRDPRQLRRSWYGAFCQLPAVPEAVLRAGDFALARRTLGRAYPPGDVERFRRALSRPGVPTAAVNYYRALRYEALDLLCDPGTVRKPALLVWGERDPWLGVELLEGIERWAPDCDVVCLEAASHWPHVEAENRVNRALIEFLAE